MQIAIVCPYSMSRPGGVQEHARGLARALVELGHGVALYAPDWRDGDAGAGIECISLGATISVPANRSVAPIGIDPRMVVRFDLALDAADVVHAHEPFLPAGIAASLRAPRGTALVGTFHASAERYLPYILSSPFLGPLARRLHATTAVSPAARQLVRRYVAVSPVIVPNGVDTGAFAAASPDPWASSLGRVVLFVGRPEPRKGFEVALRCFAAAAARLEDVHLVCVPAEPADARVLSAAASRRVHCLGRIPRDRLLALYRAAEVVLAPSLGGESFGLVVVEGLAAGSAVLASDIPGYRFAGGDAATYVPPGDLPAWRGALGRLLADEGERARLAAAGPQRAAVFDWTRVARQTVSVYEDAVGSM